MDFPLTPLKNWSNKNRPSSGGNNEQSNDVVIYSREDVVKDIHQNFVIVFGITFASIIIFVIIFYLASKVACKLLSHVRSRKVKGNIFKSFGKFINFRPLFHLAPALQKKLGSIRKKVKQWLLNLMNPIAKNGEDNTCNLEVQNSCQWIRIAGWQV